MKVEIINPSGNWEFWSQEQITELKHANNNQVVGENLVFENEEIKVWTIHLAPNHRLPFHCHNKRYFWTAMSNGKSRSYFDNGAVKETTYGIGDTKYFDNISEEHFFIHDLTNIGDTILIFNTVEFK